MHLKRLLVGLAMAGAPAATAIAERRMLRAMNAIDEPPGWTQPRFPTEAEIMVPTDDGAELVVSLAGPETEPPVVLVHGLTSSHHDWGPVATLLVEAGHRVIAINLRGHGGSTVGVDGFGPDRLGLDLGQALQALELNNVTLVGHSLGGAATLSLLLGDAARGADRVGHAVLVATLADSASVERRAVLRLGDTAQYQALANHPVHAPAAARLAFGVLPSRVLVDHALASNRSCPLATRTGAAQGLLGYDIRDQLGAIECPCVVICGTRDLFTPLRENRAIANSIPGAELIAVSGAGHLVIWEEPATVADTIAALSPATPNRAARA